MNNKINDNLPINRYAHCYNVGKRMYDYAKRKLSMNESFCVEMFTLGNIHDIGYEFDSGAFGHDILISESLKDSYKYWREIKFHSKLQTEYDTLAMRLLYFGDSTVDGYGNWCTFSERLNDIKVRHGAGSDVYTETKKIINYLIQIGFDDTI